MKKKLTNYQPFNFQVSLFRIRLAVVVQQQRHLFVILVTIFFSASGPKWRQTMPEKGKIKIGINVIDD
jgi:hypothetical protein